MDEEKLQKIREALESGDVVIDHDELNRVSESEQLIMDMSKVDYNHIRDWYVTI